MGWKRLLKPGPVDLGITHLDAVTEPGVYTQIFAGRATKAQGYPFEGKAGTLVIHPWNPSSGNVIAVFHSWDAGSAKRTLYNGAWRPWLDLTGKAVP